MQEIEHTNQQQAARTRKLEGSSLRTAKTRRRIGPRAHDCRKYRTQTSSKLHALGSLRDPPSVQPRHVVELDQVLTVASTTNAEAVKRCRNIEDGDISNRKPKRSKCNNGEPKRRISQSKENFIKAWLRPTDNENPLGELGLVPADDMAPPSLDDSGASTAVTSSTRKSDKSSVGPYDSDFRKSLGYRNIYIERKKPPKGLVWRAREIIMAALVSRG